MVIHNLSIDKIEVVKKTELLSSLPYEIPCQSLFSSLLHYQEIVSEISEKGCVQTNELTSYKLVHLKNLKEKSMIEPIIDDFGIITSAAGTTAFRSSKTLMEAHPTASSDESSQDNHHSPLKKAKTEVAVAHPITNLASILQILKLIQEKSA